MWCSSSALGLGCTGVVGSGGSEAERESKGLERWVVLSAGVCFVPGTEAVLGEG